MIEPGWQVLDKDGKELGTVAETIGDSEQDIFNGLAVATGALDRPRYVPSERVAEIRDGLVRLDLDSAQVESLPPHRAPPSLRIQAD